VKLSTLMAAILAGASALADTLYVNNVTGNDGNDGSESSPKKTIQAAISAAGAGDVISVAPGVYGDEQGSTPAATAGQTCRVWINKSLTLKSAVKGGAVITGRLATDPQGAVTAIRIAADVATTSENPVVIDGFVIRDCANDAAVAGGVIGWSASTTPSFADETGPWVVDCVISNCSITCSGVLNRVNAIRVHLRNNSGTATGLNAYYCNLAYSVLAGANGQAGVLGGAANVMVNCTIVGGSHIPTSSSNKMNLYNVIITGGVNGGANCTVARNSVFAAACTGDVDASNLISANYNKDQLAAPLYEDYRPLVATAGFCSDAVACGLGSTNWLDKIPARYRWTDIDGTAVVPSAEGRIHAGAVQTSVTPVRGFCMEDDALVFVGTTLPANIPAKNRYVYQGASDEPKAYEIAVNLAEGEHLFAFGSNDSVGYRFPNRDGKILLVPEKGVMTKLTKQLAAYVRYVNDTTGSDTDYDGTAAEASGTTGPFKTIQKAINDVGSSKLCTVYVAPGVYDEGEHEWSSGTVPRLRVVLASNRRFRIVATSTTEPTVIMGKADTTSETRDAYGNGPEAIRCLRVQSNVIGCLQGFVITGGHSDSASASLTTAKNGGALVCEKSPNFWLMDCVVTNNTCAGSGTAMYGGRAARCVFRDNPSASSGGTAFSTYPSGGVYCWLSGCVIAAASDKATQFLVGDDVTLANCTVWSPAAGGKVLTSNNLGYLFNTLVVNNGSIGTAGSECIAGNVLDNTPYVSANPLNVEPVAFTRGAGLLVDPANGDFHVATASAALGKGTAWGGLDDATRWTEGAAYSNFYAIVQHDFDGNGFNMVNGKPTAGAYQRPSKHLMVVTANRVSHVTADSVGTNYVGFGETVVLSAEAKDGRQVVGYVVDGETHSCTTYAYTAPGPEASAAIDVQVLVNTNWYVDATNGSDDGRHGWSEADAFLSLSIGMANAEAGDTVIALPGTYREKSMLQAEGFLAGDAPTMPSRVVVKDGVALVSRDGAAATVIEGVTPAGTFGDGAMRCVYLRPGSTLRGFTVTGGSSRTYETTGKGDDYGVGGVLCAADPNATVEPSIWVYDCIISNNCGRTYAGGAYYGGGFVRCRFFDNRCRTAAGGVAMVSRLYECVLDRNRGTTGCSRPYRARGCTFGGNNLTWDGNPATAIENDPSSSATLWPMWNCLFLGGLDCYVRCAYNCIVPREGFLKTARDTQVLEDITVAAVSVDAGYVPAYDSAAANAANMDYVLPVELEGDVYGNPRRSNGGLDVGAVETDWRGRYAWNLGKRRLTVTVADWNVVENPDKSVRLPDGASLACRWNLAGVAPATPTVSFTVAEGATLTVSRAGSEPVVFGPGAGQLALNDAQELETLSFLADGGAVDLASFATNKGALLIVR